MVEISDLPGEMLMSVFSWVPPKELKNVVLVSKRWRKIGEDPSLWSGCRFTVNNRDDITKLSIRRLRYIQEICIDTRGYWHTSSQSGHLKLVTQTMRDGNKDVWYVWQDCDWEALFQALLNLPRLKKLVLKQNNLSSLEPEIIARALQHIQEICIVSAYTYKWKAGDWETLFQALINLPKLKKMVLGGNDLSTINPELFVNALASLEDVNLHRTFITDAQTEALFASMAQNRHMKIDSCQRPEATSGNRELCAW